MADDGSFSIVARGDHLEKIAARLGFDPAAVWADSWNEALRAKRASGNVLYPGDVLLVPPVKRKWLPSASARSITSRRGCERSR